MDVQLKVIQKQKPLAFRILKIHAMHIKNWFEHIPPDRSWIGWYIFYL